jgi:hypothetical protein
MISVALPIWQSNRIAWLCMESLCRQHKPSDNWELVVFEEMHPQEVGEEWIKGYEERLSLAGCVRVHYLTCIDKLSLSEKWVLIARATSEESKVFCLCAADNYYHPFMLRDAEEAIKEADWCVQPKGYFYDFDLDKVVLYQHNATVGLQMYARTEMVREFPLDVLKCGIDTWFCNQMMHIAHSEDRNLKIWIDGSEHYKNTLCTNGLNNISIARVNLIEGVREPFYESDLELEEIIPEDIYLRIKETSECLKSL